MTATWRSLLRGRMETMEGRMDPLWCIPNWSYI